MNIDYLLAAKLLSGKLIKKIITTDLIIEEESKKIYFLFKAQTGKTLKNGTEQVRLYKNNISTYVKNHGSVDDFFKSLVVGEMIIRGYIIVPIEGGFLCVGGDEIYSIKDNTCTCQAFINDSSKPCKHIVYKEGLLKQRARINKWKMNNIK